VPAGAALRLGAGRAAQRLKRARAGGKIPAEQEAAMNRTRRLVIGLAVLGVLGAARARAQEGDDPESRLKNLGLTLPTPAAPVANYVRAVRTGNLVFLAGHGECSAAQTGKLGAGVTVEQGYASARRVGLCLLASLKQEIGDLRRVRRFVKVLGMVNSAPDFADQPKVINGFSDLMVSVFGERGRHARSAVGMGALPGGISVEIEAVVEVGD
jgi:enamine deaminase RidA (YjgF/YER057c/UK114 family)